MSKSGTFLMLNSFLILPLFFPAEIFAQNCTPKSITVPAYSMVRVALQLAKIDVAVSRQISTQNFKKQSQSNLLKSAIIRA